MDPVVHKYNEYVITSFLKSVQPVVVESAEGAIVRGRGGKEFIDCFAGISVVNAGHCNRKVVEAARAQMEKLIHCCSYMYYVEPVADLAEKIATITPGKLKKTFFANSGAEAIEGAVKLAKLFTGKSEVISLEASFHGRTWGTLSLTGNSGRKRRGGPYAPGVAFAPAPYSYRSTLGSAEEVGEKCASAIEQIIRLHTADNVAAFIAEPIMGEGGIIVPPANYFKAVKAVLDKHKIVFIADEVQTGFARTGKMFAIEHYGVEPDLLVTAKGIADGFPLSGFTTTDEIAAAFQPGDHLSTFGGNPVSCAAALANIQYLQDEHVAEKSAALGVHATERITAATKNVSLVGEVRGKGLMIGIELVRDSEKSPASREAEVIRTMCLERGLLIGVGGIYGNVLRIQPPLTISKVQLDQALDTVINILRNAPLPESESDLRSETRE
jgi:4-aminobutyrate aminotransferase / (S)-3-amino-2-methylpropionate transaminase / 5-aminovalerate transaminase